ncbi:hypothetical protein F183_A10840 [Bryobacterales bacterium F-183]|nr:hypothetical protein F183_A10840 [Bryobacterales bacterium F-183]
MMRTQLLLLLALPLALCAATTPSTHSELLQFYKDWREFQHPVMVDGVPDYSAAAMKKQYAALKTWQQKLAAFDISKWTVAEKIDYNLIRAEMNGLEFDHRVLRPWARAPFFYSAVKAAESDTPLHEGPHVYGVLELWQYKMPLSEGDAADVRTKLLAVPNLMAQAKTNLTEPNKDLWTLGIWFRQQEVRTLETLAEQNASSHPELAAAAKAAAKATADFVTWLEAGVKKMPASTSKPLGIEQYNWHLKHVQLSNYTWQTLLQSLERELSRSLSTLAMLRNRNRNLPELKVASSLEELNQRNDQAIDYFMDFLRKQEIFTVPEYMNLNRLRPVRRLSPPEALDIFSNVEYRDSLPMKCHMVHWLEKQRLDREPHPSPVRSSRLLYNIWMGRSEGFATAWEETMTQAGLLADRPRAQELIQVMIAVRAIRGIADLKFHSGEFTLDQAMKYIIDTTPNGWFNPKGSTIWVDMGIYAHQPGYGTTYLSGKLEFERLIADYATKKGKAFTMKTFMDEFFAKGVIPFSAINWEMTGNSAEVKAIGFRQ